MAKTDNNMAQTIRVESAEYIDGIWVRATVKGIRFNGEYDVDIFYAEQCGSYTWHTTEREHVTCKRVSTINKKLAARGFRCKVA